VQAPVCGDSFIQPGEQCDDGNLNTDACLAAA
jgi:cysteine-rich repeat protein